MVGLAARLVVGGVWLYAGWIKIGDPEGSVTAVRAYQLLPLSLADAVGRVLPALEMAIGACLVLGLLTRMVAGLSALLQVAFIIGITSVWVRHIPIDCGCFGPGGAAGEDAFSHYPWEIARDTGLFLLSLWMVIRPVTPYAVDSIVFRRGEEVDVEEEG